MKKYLKIILATAAITVVGVTGWSIFYRHSLVAAASSPEAQAVVKTMTTTELAKYNGADSTLPIYIGLNGLVYDVTAGRIYYDNNGSYHYLAGRDSSSELNMIGGDIIVRKYRPIAKLIP